MDIAQLVPQVRNYYYLTFLKGSACSGGTGGITTTCSGNTYSREGQQSCTSLPTGWKMTSTSSLPTACAVGQGGTSCSTCTGGQYAPTSGSAPTVPGSCTTCSGTTTFSSGDKSYCRKCTEGYACSGGNLGTACSSGRYSAFGSGSCSNAVAGSFAPSTKFNQITLTGTGD